MSRSAERPCLLVFERGLSIPIPDLQRLPGLLFPVLGDYCLLDFLLASTGPLAASYVMPTCERSISSLFTPRADAYFGISTLGKNSVE